MIHQSDWELLCALYEYRSITRAAQALYLAQPAVTRRLSQLEGEFGVTIAVRHSKGLLFTPEGEVLVRHAQRMVQEYSALEDTLRGEAGRLFGTLHLASSGSLARFVLPGLLGNFKRMHPAVEFSLTSEFSYKVSQMINTRRAQIGFLRGDYESGCKRILIGQQHAAVVSREPFRLEDLPSMPRIDFYADALSIAMIDSWWYEHFREPPVTAITVGSGSTCAEMVKNGLGYGIFLTGDFIAGHGELARVPMLHKDGEPVTRNDWMVFREESLEIDIVRAFVTYAEAYMKERGQQEEKQ